jgi:hypothetical protein
MPRKTINAVKVDTNVRCTRVYPREDTKRQMSELKTVGIQLNREQAAHLGLVLLMAAREWDQIDITAYRFDRRSEDGSYRLTVTSLVEEHNEDDIENAI